VTRPPYALDLSPETAQDLLELLEQYEQGWRAKFPCGNESRRQYNLHARDAALSSMRGLLKYHARRGGQRDGR
jgi:hypothetical protein